MGRGRAKAKQTKVARDLKYNSQEMDLDRLAKELHGEGQNQQSQEDDDPYADGNYIRWGSASVRWTFATLNRGIGRNANFNCTTRCF